MLIRPERPDEFGEIFRLVRDAFKSARVSDGDEQEFVNRLRAGPGYVPELALVGEEKEKLAGFVMLTELPVINEDADPDEAEAFIGLLLGPLAVVGEGRKQGRGAALVREALKRAGAMSYKAVFLVGDPAYYSRFGFKAAGPYGISYPGLEGEWARFVQAVELEPGALKGVSGVMLVQD